VNVLDEIVDVISDMHRRCSNAHAGGDGRYYQRCVAESVFHALPGPPCVQGGLQGAPCLAISDRWALRLCRGPVVLGTQLCPWPQGPQSIRRLTMSMTPCRGRAVKLACGQLESGPAHPKFAEHRKQRLKIMVESRDAPVRREKPAREWAADAP
jgi:hypothetical protein